MLDPLDIERFSLACRRFYALAQHYMSTTPYAALLARSMLMHCTVNVSELRHRRGCCRGYCWCRYDFAALTQAVERRVVAALTGRARPTLDGWEKVDYFRILYPGAAQLPRWPLATHALEWCARHERDILWMDEGPRREILALLYPDATSSLRDLAEVSGDSKFGYRAMALMKVAAVNGHVGGQRTWRLSELLDSYAHDPHGAHDIICVDRQSAAGSATSPQRQKKFG
jgi:hypothetical protein